MLFWRSPAFCDPEKYSRLFYPLVEVALLYVHGQYILIIFPETSAKTI